MIRKENIPIDSNLKNPEKDFDLLKTFGHMVNSGPITAAEGSEYYDWHIEVNSDSLSKHPDEKGTVT